MSSPQPSSEPLSSSAPMTEPSPAPMTVLSSNYGAGASNRDELELDQETPSSSLRAGDGPGPVESGDEDDPTPSSPNGEGDRDPLASAEAAIDRQFGDGQAEQLRADRGRVEKQIRIEVPRIDPATVSACIVAAVCYAAQIGKKGVKQSLVGYVWSCSRNFARIGINPVAAAAVERFSGPPSEDPNEAKLRRERDEREASKIPDPAPLSAKDIADLQAKVAADGTSPVATVHASNARTILKLAGVPCSPGGRT